MQETTAEVLLLNTPGVRTMEEAQSRSFEHELSTLGLVRLIGVSDLQELLQVSSATLYRRLERGNIPTLTVPGRKGSYVPLDAVRDLLAHSSKHVSTEELIALVAQHGAIVSQNQEAKGSIAFLNAIGSVFDYLQRGEKA